MFRFLTTVLFLSVLVLQAADSIGQSFTEVNCTNCGSENGGYLIYEPPSYDDGRSQGYSLIINLHGQSEAGTLAKAESIGIPRAITNPNRDVFDGYEDEFIVALPSTDNTDDWNISQVDQFVEFIKANYNINENRVYITGLSMGAKGAWDYALNYPNKVTAVVSLMGSAAPGIDPCVLNNVAIWSIQGESDGIFPPNDVNETGRLGVQLISSQITNTCTPAIEPAVTILPGKTHGGWEEAAEGLSGFNVFDWMSQFTAIRNGSGVKTGLNVEGTPLVDIGPDRIFLASQQTYFFHSFILDPNDPDNSGITNLEWSITPSAGNLSDTGDEMLKVTSLPVGTYTVQLTVTDNEGKSNSDQITVEIVNTPPTGSPIIEKIELWSNISGTWAYVQDLTEYQNLTFEELGDAFDFKIIDDGIANSFRHEYGNNFAFRRANSNIEFFGLNGHSDYVPGIGEFVLAFTGYDRASFALTGPGATRQYRINISASPLPVNFIGFTGKATLNGVELKWLTSDEQGNSHFEIYRGRDQESFQKIGEVPKTPDPQLVNEYTFTDTEAEGGVYYYQVKNVDYDGHVDLTEIIRIDVETARDRYYLYPNPSAEPVLKIRVPDDLYDEPLEIRISNANGQEVMKFSDVENGLIKTVDISNLAPGLYHVRIFQNGEINHFRVIRE